MKPVDLARFWQDNEAALADPFGERIPQFPMTLGVGYFAMFAELGLEQDMWRVETDDAFVRRCAAAYNDKAEAIIGRRPLNEDYDLSRQFPHVKTVGELFGCDRIWESQSWWLTQAADNPRELEQLLDRVDRLDIEAAMFPDDWDAECRRIHDQHGLRPVLGHHLRGPVTVAMSIYGVENLIYLILDAPELAGRFRNTLLRVIREYFRIADRRSDPERLPAGFSFADDQCAMLSPEMYAFFAQPILKAVFDEFAPRPGDYRYQHSDSDMGHLLDLLAETGLTGVNFGPTVRFADIRRAMPRAVVHGTYSPMALMRNEEDRLIAEVGRDIDEARATRGLVVASAGSVNDGTRLTSFRTIMHTLQTRGRLN